MKPGVYKINEHEYHENPEFDAIHSSDFKNMEKSMQHFLWYRQHPPEKDVFNVGRLFHFLVLEPEKFFEQVAVFDGTRRGKKWDAFQEENQNKIIIKPNDFELIKAMAEAVNQHPVASAIVNHKGAAIEESIFWYDPATGEKCKCRPDIRVTSEKLIADLKGVVSARPSAFSKACADYGYQFQAPFYLDGATNAISEHDTFLFIVCEKQPPHGVAVYQANYEFIETGRIKYQELLMQYSQCKIENKWPGYPVEIQEIGLPKWATFIDLGN